MEETKWEARYSPDVGWYARHGESVEATWYPEHANKAHELADYLNVLEAKTDQCLRAMQAIADEINEFGEIVSSEKYDWFCEVLAMKGTAKPRSYREVI